MTVKDRNLAVDDLFDETKVIKVAGGSDPHGVATAISNTLYENREAVIRCVGAASTNQALKAVAISRGYVAQRGLDLICRPGFTNIPSQDDPDKSVTAILLRLSLR